MPYDHLDEAMIFDEPPEWGDVIAGLSLLATPNGFSRFMVPLTISFASGGIW